MIWAHAQPLRFFAPGFARLSDPLRGSRLRRPLKSLAHVLLYEKTKYKKHLPGGFLFEPRLRSVLFSNCRKAGDVSVSPLQGFERANICFMQPPYSKQLNSFHQICFMKKILRFLAGLGTILLLLLFLAWLSGNGYLVKGLWASYLHGYNSASIGDARFFKTRNIAGASQASEWPLSEKYNRIPLSGKLEESLLETQSVAFLIVRNDSILCEKYWDQYSDSSLSNSFSMAKSITTMLTQIAIQKGLLKGWNQKVKDLLPDLKGPYADELKLWHLSTMSSGMDWDEKYKDPFSVTAKAYYGENLGALMLSLPIKDKPGTFYNYQSGSTQLLGMCVMKAAGKPLAELASNWLWKPLQAERPASWHTDEQGMELAYCCFNSNARDFARFGKLMLQHGRWNGIQILDSSFVANATRGALVPYYGYSFWIDDSHGTRVFYQRGILGQYIISIPEYNAVVVRLGHRLIPPEEGDHHSPNYHVIIEETLKMFRAQS